MKLELTTDDGKSQVSELGSILRSSSDPQSEDVGLTLRRVDCCFEKWSAG
jgi:hypothetical protein